MSVVIVESATKYEQKASSMWSSNLKRAAQICLFCVLCIYLCQFFIYYDNAANRREFVLNPNVSIAVNDNNNNVNVDNDIGSTARHNATTFKSQLEDVQAEEKENLYNVNKMPSRPSLMAGFGGDILSMTTSDVYNKLTLDDVYISVKTTRKYHHTRLPVILNTWFQLAKDQTWFFTDTDDPKLFKSTGGHMVNTRCPPTHARPDLCCKMSVEFDSYLETNKKWFCHFDDDNYVNVPRLVEVLSDFDPKRNWYLGKNSVKKPVRMTEKVSFWFATGGAGFCLSKALALKMMPVAGGGKFMTIADEIGYPDDVSMGYIIEHLMDTKLVVIPEFRSHLETMKHIRPEEFKKQISFGYFGLNSPDVNVIQIDGFSVTADPTRFYSLHCLLFPNAAICPK